MGRDTVLQEDMDDEKPGEVAGCDGVMGRDEDALFIFYFLFLFLNHFIDQWA